MKTFMIMAIMGISLFALFSWIGRQPVYLSYPEKGITCIRVKSVWDQTFIGAGCFIGDVSGDNRLSYAHSAKYQKNWR